MSAPACSSMAASTAAAPSSALLTADALPVIDLRVFTQSELRALSKSSASSVYELSYRFGGEEDVPVPKIDRAVFNESAGSRKQTYSRLRLAPRKPEITTSRVGEVRSRMDEVDNWENRRIVGMLKELVGEGSGEAEVFDGLVAVEIECDPELNLPDVEMVRHPVKVEVGAVSPVRRKRGRPRKDSDVTANKIVLYNSQDVDEFGGEKLCESKKKNNEEDDMEMVNKNGVVVDLVALGNADDPFGPEMRRQTEGMSTKEQLLEFLNGLDGKWVSRRRKRKIVDASYFGDVLPNGWKLLFSIKKKSGHAWLICRRYISPSGREFISCKEVASYLQHLSGMQSEGPKNTICNDENIMLVEKFPTENVGNQFVQDDVILDQHPSRSLIPNLATQVEPESHISLSATTKNDGSPHILPSSPKSKLKRRKLGTLVSDGVIITDGKFECQFCHKIFEERRRYNGHVGVHVRNVEALRGTGTKSAGADLCSVSGVLPVASSMDITAISSSGAQENHNDGTITDVMELGFLHTKLVDGSEVGDCTGKSNIEMSHSQVNVEVKQNIIDEAVFEQSNDKSDRNYKMAEDAVGKLDKSSSIGAEMCHSVAPQTKPVENDLLELCEVSRISMSEGLKTVGEDGNSEKSTVVYNAAGKQSEGDEKSNGDSASFGEKLIADVESIQHAVDETFNGENNIGSLVTNGNEEHTIDFTEQFGNERSPFNLGMVDNGQEDVCAFYQQRSAGSSSHASFLNEQRHSSINCENAAVASRLVEYKENFPEKNPPNSVRNKQGLTASNNFLDGISGHSSTPDFMHPSILGIQPAVVSSSNHATLGGNDWSRDTPQKIFGVTHLFPSLSQNMGANNVKTTSTDVNSKSPWKQPTFNPQIAVDSVDRASNGMISKEFWKAVDVPSNSVAKTGSEAMLDMAVVSRCGQGKVSGDYSFSSLGNEQGFNIRSDMVGMVDNSMQESRLERDYVSDFINPFDNGQSNRAPSKLFPTRPMEQPRPDEARFSLNSELQISLGNDQSRLDAINRNLKGQSLVLSGNEHFGLHNNSNAFYNSSVEEPRDQRARGSGLMGQFGQQELFGLQNNLNQAYNDSVWGGEQRIGPIGNFGPNDPMTFGSSQTQRSENVLTGGLWSVGANAHGFVDLSLSRGQPSSYLPNLQMMSSKGDDQFFGGVQKINNPGGFQDQRGGIQQREYNFLNANAKPYTQDTNVLPYEQQIQQSYDHASWLGRQAPFPQVLARNPPTASCVWCSNVFYLESLNSFSQADTIVPACPSCKTKMTEQLNLS